MQPFEFLFSSGKSDVCVRRSLPWTPVIKRPDEMGSFPLGGGCVPYFWFSGWCFELGVLGVSGFWGSGPLCRAGAGVFGFMVAALVLDKEAASQTVSASVAPDSQSL